MPALVLYGGYRTFVGGDDLRVFTIFALLLRCIQILVLIVITILTVNRLAQFRDISDLNERSCDFEALPRQKLLDKAYAILVAYLTISYFLALFGFALEVGIWRTGAKGTPVQQSARARLKPLCLMKMFPMSIVRIFALTLGIYTVFVLREVCSCDGRIENPSVLCPMYNHWHGFVYTLILTHFMEISVVFLYVMFFLTKSTRRMPSFMSKESKWQFFCKCCCTVTTLLTCCLHGGRDNKVGDFADIGMILADFFDGGGHLDVVLSDIMVGLRMLAHQHRRRKIAAGQEPGQVHDDEEIGLPPKGKDYSGEGKRRRQSLIYQVQYSSDKLVFAPALRDVLSRLNPNDKFAIAEGARFIRFSASIYDFKPSVAADKCPAPGNKVAGCFSCCCATLQEEAGYNLVGRKIGAGFEIAEEVHDKFLQIAGLDQGTKIVYIQFGEGLARTPYFIALDRSWKSIVIAIRGTKGLDDVVADLTIRPDSMEEWGNKCNFDGKDGYAHAGMLAVAEWIFNDLER